MCKCILSPYNTAPYQEENGILVPNYYPSSINSSKAAESNSHCYLNLQPRRCSLAHHPHLYAGNSINLVGIRNHYHNLPNMNLTERPRPVGHYSQPFRLGAETGGLGATEILWEAEWVELAKQKVIELAVPKAYNPSNSQFLTGQLRHIQRQAHHPSESISNLVHSLHPYHSHPHIHL